MAIEVIEGLQRKATFKIDKDQIQELAKPELKRYAKNAKLPGFRPGKVPQSKLEQMYGGSAYEDALNKQINHLFIELVTSNKLDLAGEPKFELKSSEGTDFIFDVTFEIMPKVELKDLKDQPIEELNCCLDDKDIDDTIEILRKQKATYVEDNIKAASNDDKVVIDFSGTLDGVKFDGGSANDYEFILGQQAMLPDFEKGILGLKIGETTNIDVVFPDNYNSIELKGKTAQFEITLKKISTPNLPELNDEFIQSIGVSDGNLATLRKDIKHNLDKEVQRQIQAKVKEAALNALYNANPIEVPHSLVHSEIHHMMDNARQKMLKQGYPEEQIKLTHDMFKEDAKRIVTLRILFNAFIQENSITITDADTRAIVEDLATMYNDPAEYIEWFYKDKTNVNNASNMALENKVIELIKTKALVTTKDITYKQLIKENS